MARRACVLRKVTCPFRRLAISNALSPAITANPQRMGVRPVPCGGHLPFLVQGPPPHLPPQSGAEEVPILGRHEGGKERRGPPQRCTFGVAVPSIKTVQWARLPLRTRPGESLDLDRGEPGRIDSISGAFPAGAPLPSETHGVNSYRLGYPYSSAPLEPEISLVPQRPINPITHPPAPLRSAATGSGR